MVCPIVRGEIGYGIERLPTGRRRERLERRTLHLFGMLTCEPILESAAGHYAEIKAACESKGLSLDENDLWIAATALSLGATVVSRDSDFQRVDRLNVVDWTK